MNAQLASEANARSQLSPAPLRGFALLTDFLRVPHMRWALPLCAAPAFLLGVWGAIVLAFALCCLWLPLLLDLHRAMLRARLGHVAATVMSAAAAIALTASGVAMLGAWAAGSNPAIAALTALAFAAIAAFVWTSTPGTLGFGFYATALIGVFASFRLHEGAKSWMKVPIEALDFRPYGILVACIALFAGIAAWRWRKLVRVERVFGSLTREPLAAGRWKRDANAASKTDANDSRKRSLRERFGTPLSLPWWLGALRQIGSLTILALVFCGIAFAEWAWSPVFYVAAALTIPIQIALSMAYTLVAVRQLPFAACGLPELAMLPASRSRLHWALAVLRSSHRVKYLNPFGLAFILLRFWVLLNLAGISLSILMRP